MSKTLAAPLTKVRTRTTRAANAPKRAISAAPRGLLHDATAVAGDMGLLSGTRTRIIRARMPAQLVEAAKQNTGIKSDSQLLERALALAAVRDNYGDWLISQRGTINQELDLEF